MEIGRGRVSPEDTRYFLYLSKKDEIFALPFEKRKVFPAWILLSGLRGNVVPSMAAEVEKFQVMPLRFTADIKG